MSEGEGLYLIYSSHAVYCCTIFTHTEVVEQSNTRAISSLRSDNAGFLKPFWFVRLVMYSVRVFEQTKA